MPFSARIVWADVNNVLNLLAWQNPGYQFADAVSPTESERSLRGPHRTLAQHLLAFL